MDCGAGRGAFAGSIVAAVAVLLGCWTPAQAAELSGDLWSTEFSVSGFEGTVRMATGPEGLDVVDVDGLPLGGEPGEPLLPYYQVKVLLPADADLSQIQAWAVDEEWSPMHGGYDIAPAPPAVTWDGTTPIIDWGRKNKARIRNGKDVAIYARNADFPAAAVEVVSTGEYRQWKLAEVRIWCAKFNPAGRAVHVLNGAQIAVAAPRTGELPSMPAASGVETDPFLMLDEIINPQDAALPAESSSPPPAAGTAADYVIITTSTIQSTSSNLSSFITNLQACGHAVKVVTEGTSADDTHYVTGTSCYSRADNIRSWLGSHWTTDGISYVLLIGDPHPTTFTSNQSIPMRMCYPRPGADVPTDMYFAELSGNWNLDSDGYYGEYSGDYGTGGADKYCELMVGRIPYYGSTTDLDSILQKCINYTQSSTRAWRSKVLIPAAISNHGPQDNNGDGDASDSGIDYPYTSWRTFGADWGEAIKSLASSAGFSAYTLYERTGVYSNGSAYPLTSCNAALTTTNIVNEWQNTYGFVTWWAHGSQTGASRFCWTSDGSYTNICGNASPHKETTWYTMFSSSDCSSLNDSYPSFAVLVSCLNGYPENSGNLGYSLLKQGAIGTFSGSRVTWYAIGSWNTSRGGSYGDNASYAYRIFNRMSAATPDTAGAALVWCRSNFGLGWGDASWMNMLDFNLYGDPALSRLTSPAPQVYNISPNTGATGATVNINPISGAYFQTGATVMLAMPGQPNISATAVTVVNSSTITCTFNLAGATPGAWNVVVTNPDTQSGTLAGGFAVTGQFTDIGAALAGVAYCDVDWGDYDNDGLLDLALAGDTGAGFITKVYRNLGGVSFTDIGAPLPGITHASLAWGDYDGDGNLDLALCGLDNGLMPISRVYQGDGAGNFIDAGAGLIGVQDGSVDWGDYDNDGDMDLALTGYDAAGVPFAIVYRNDGGGAFTDIGAALIPVGLSEAVWGDYDNDGDLDLALAGRDAAANPVTRLFQNNGGVFMDSGIPFVLADSCVMAWGDYDYDSDLDLIIGGTAGGLDNTILYDNMGTMLTNSGVPFTGVSNGDVAWGDYDNDGDVDIALTGIAAGVPYTTLYRNDFWTFTAVSMRLAAMRDSAVAWGDYDNDGDLDLALAGFSGSAFQSKIYRNGATAPNTPPAAPMWSLPPTVSWNKMTFSWNPGTDIETPQAGLSYNLRLGTAPGGQDVTPAMADPTTGFRRVPALGNVQENLQWSVTVHVPGTYYVSVQTVDAALAGSPWAPEQPVVVPPIPGDADLDGSVDVVDLGILATNYGATSGKTWADGDFSGDGAVDVVDLGILATYYGQRL